MAAKIGYLCVTQTPLSPTPNTLTVVFGVDTFNTCSLSWGHVLSLHYPAHAYCPHFE